MGHSEVLVVDGARGGGQILRSALSLALCLGRPFRIINIRAVRPRPGLARQHLTAVMAAAEVGQAHVEGATQGSRELLFVPGAVKGGDFHFQIGTAGSTTLVLQTVLPALLCLDTASRLIIEGGTHNLLAPPYEFLKLAFLPLLKRMGPDVDIRLECPGFYPRGGGRIDVEVKPAPRLQPLHLPERGTVLDTRAQAVVSRLPEHIARRELDVIRAGLGLSEPALQVRQEQRSPGPGNVVLVTVESEHVTEVFTGFGERGVKAETVARRVVAEVKDYLAADVPVGPLLAG